MASRNGPAVARRFVALSLAAALLWAGCSTDTAIGPGPVAAVRIVPDSVLMVVGTADTLHGFGLDASGALLASKPVSWSTTNPTVATVGASGIVTGTGLGVASVIASLEGYADTALVRVLPPPALDVTPDTVTFNGVAGSGALPDQTASVTNSGGGSLRSLRIVSITFGSGAAGWVTAALNQTSTPAILTLQASSAGIAVGSYTAKVAVGDTAATNTPDTVVVRLVLSAGAPTAMAASAGTGQSATVNTTVATRPAVRVVDAFGNGVAGVAVTFAIGSGGGAVTGGGTTTDATGTATVGSWRLGTTAGNNTLLATTPALPGTTVTISATGTAGAATQMTKNLGDLQSAIAGSTVGIDPSVLVRDQFNNPVSGVTVTFSVTATNGSLTGATVNSDVAGVAAVGSWTLGTTAKTDTLLASATGLTGSPLRFTATATAGPATQVAINAGNGQTAFAGNAVAVAPSVIVRDVNNNPVAGVPVTFAIGSGGGSFAGPAIVSTNGSGIAAVGSWTLGTTAGPNTLTATAGALAGSPITFNSTGSVGPAALLTANSSTTLAGTAGLAVTPAPSVRVTDINGNGVAGVNVTFVVTAGGGSITGAATLATNASGVVTVGGWTLGTTAGANTMTATSGTLTGSPVSFTATGNAGTARNIAMVPGGNNQSGTVGSTLGTPLTVLVTDNGANPVSGFTVAWGASSGGAITPSSVTDASGHATATWTLGTTAGGQTATATASGLTGSPVTFNATATASGADPATSTVAVSPAGITASTGSSSTTITVTARDAFSNPIPGATIAFFATGSGNTLAPASATADGLGVATATFSSTVAAAKTISATANGTAITQTPLVTVSPAAVDGALSTIASSTPTLTASSGSSSATITVTARDAFGNLISGQGVSLGLTATGTNALTQPSTTTNASGQTTGSFSAQTAGTKTISATIGATAVTSGDATITVGPASAFSIAMTNAGTMNNQAATVNTAVAVPPSVTILDAFGNPVPGVNVTFTPSVTSGTNGGVPGASAIVASDGSGIAAVSTWRLGTTSSAINNNFLSAASAGLSGSPVTYSAQALTGAAAIIALDPTYANGDSARVRTALTPNPRVLVTDAFGNPVSGTSVTFTVFSGGGTVNATSSFLTSTNTSGIATSAAWVIDTVSSGTVGGAFPNVLRATAAVGSGSPVTINSRAFYTLSLDVQPIFTGACTGCHFSGGTAPNLPNAATTYAQTVGVGSVCAPGQIRVFPGNAATSLLMLRMDNTSASCPSPMPPAGIVNAQTRAIVRAWINHGALND
jgi:adhesin/invasin